MRKNRCADVAWYLPKRKRPFMYTTRSASDLIALLSKQTVNKTPLEILPLIEYDIEAKKVLEAYIEKGYGDLKLSLN